MTEKILLASCSAFGECNGTGVHIRGTGRGLKPDIPDNEQDAGPVTGISPPYGGSESYGPSPPTQLPTTPSPSPSDSYSTPSSSSFVIKEIIIQQPEWKPPPKLRQSVWKLPQVRILGEFRPPSPHNIVDKCAFPSKRSVSSRKFLPVRGEGHRPYYVERPITDDNLFESRVGLAPLVEMIEEIAKGYADDNQPIFVNDLDGAGHRGHKSGTEADILVRLTKGYPPDGGPLSSFRGLDNVDKDCKFVEGKNYDSEGTFDLMRKFLDYRGMTWSRDFEKQYRVEVSELITADKSLYDRLRAGPDYHGRVILDRPPVKHARHFHIKISTKPWIKEIPMSETVEEYMRLQRMIPPKIQFQPVPPFPIRDLTPPKKPFLRRVLDRIHSFFHRERV